LNQTVGIHKNNLDRKVLNATLSALVATVAFLVLYVPFPDGTLNKQSTSAVGAQDSYSGGFPSHLHRDTNWGYRGFIQFLQASSSIYLEWGNISVSTNNLKWKMHNLGRDSAILSNLSMLGS
jgi:hypothetical protein